MRFTLAVIAFAASVIAAPVAKPDAQGTYGSYGMFTTISVYLCKTCTSVYGNQLTFSGTYDAPVPNPPPPAGGYGTYGSYANTPPPAGGYGSYGTYKKE